MPTGFWSAAAVLGAAAALCAEATRRVRDGDRMRIDGNRGEIHILGRS